MSTVVEIEDAIKKLPREEAHRLWDWFLDYFEDELEGSEDCKKEIEEGRREIAMGGCRLSIGAGAAILRP